MARFCRRLRIAFAASVLLAVGTGEHLLCAALGALYIAVIAYATGDAWLCERERRSVRR